MKKVLVLVLILIITLVNVNVLGSTVQKDDITSHEYEEAIRDLISKGIVTLDSNGNFNPDRSIRASELLSMTARFIRHYKEYNKDYSVTIEELQQKIFSDEESKAIEALSSFPRKHNIDDTLGLYTVGFIHPQVEQKNYIQVINEVQGLNLSKDKWYYEDSLYMGYLLKRNVQRLSFFYFFGFNPAPINAEYDYYSLSEDAFIIKYYNQISKAKVWDLLDTIVFYSKLPPDDKIDREALLEFKDIYTEYSISDYSSLFMHPLLINCLDPENGVPKYAIELIKKYFSIDYNFPNTEISKAETAYLFSKLCKYYDMRILRAKLIADPNYMETEISIPYYKGNAVNSSSDEPNNIVIFIKTNKLCSLVVNGKEVGKTFLRYGAKDFNEDVGLLEGYWQVINMESPLFGDVKIEAIDEAGNKTTKKINIKIDSLRYEFN